MHLGIAQPSFGSALNYHYLCYYKDRKQIVKTLIFNHIYVRTGVFKKQFECKQQKKEDYSVDILHNSRYSGDNCISKDRFVAINHIYHYSSYNRISLDVKYQQGEKKMIVSLYLSLLRLK